MQYRPEIDGLRAIAVVPVILFHAGFTAFAGGFAGVDVFFVISGYLITGILIADLEQDRFSLARFYERRARRILPALFVVLLACLPFAWLWMLPSQMDDFAQGLMAVVLFCSNILFWRQDGYFAPSAEINPLLHTWSLAVEEQYYLLFPLLLRLLWPFGRTRVFQSVAVIAMASLILAEWGWRHWPGANFYLAPGRAWELLSGSLCAFLTVGRTARSSNVLSATGLALIGVSFLGYDEGTPFPSLWTLAPVTGTALIILYGGTGTWVGRLLSLRPLVGIGLVSYSAYLWHQPLFAFARLRSLTEPGAPVMAALATAALILAWATWRWVERPFRNSATPRPATRQGVFVLSGLAGAVLVALGLAGHLGEGLEGRFGDRELRFAAAAKDRAEGDCNFSRDRPLNAHPQPQCLSPAGGKVDAMLIGDSHMWAISDAMRRALDEARIGYYLLSHTSCLPLPGFRTFDGARIYNCDDFLSGSYRWAKAAGVSTVVLAARFPLYLRGNRYDNGEGGIEPGEPGWVDLIDRRSSAWNDPERQARVLSALERQIRLLAQDFRVVLVYPVPEAGWNVPEQAFRNAYFNDGDPALGTSYAAYTARTAEVTALFDRLVAELASVHAARIAPVLCQEGTGRCTNADAEGVYYYDDDHLSNAGARLVAPVIVQAVEAALGRKTAGATP